MDVGPLGVLREISGHTNYGVEFDAPLNPDDDPLEDGLGVDATIMMETYPVWPTLYTNVALKDGTMIFPEPGQVVEGLWRATLVTGPMQESWWALEFQEDYYDAEFEVQAIERLQKEEYLTIQQVVDKLKEDY